MVMQRALLVFTLCLPLAAKAQEEMGLDFSEAKTPPQFRPSVAFIGVTPDQAEEPLAARAKLLEAELLKLIKESESFGTVKTPLEAAQVSTTARKCLDFACLEALAEKLGVHRIVTCSLAKAGPGTVLTINGFDPTFNAVLPSSVESNDKQEKAKIGGFAGIAGKSQGDRDRDFVNKVRGPFNELLKKVATPLGTLSVDVIEQAAVTRLRGKELGTGSFEKALPAGNYELEVSMAEYQTFTTSVTVEPMKVAEVKVTLVARPVERVVEQVTEAPPAPEFYKRPGLYVALVGAVLMGVGFTFGGMAKSTENRAVDADHNGIIDITRTQANTARTQALLANVFVSVGAVAFAAGAIWAFIIPLIPTRAARAPAPATPAPGDPAEGSGFGFAVGAGGTF
ncbi:MAG: PEGA domain-containing protein [Archangiaceae bacterium]|nr:PEGA domain-containing protein [Archangiaceae bacterium]